MIARVFLIVALVAASAASASGNEPGPRSPETVPVDDPAASGSAKSQPTMLEDIVVTANKRRTLLRNLPMSVSAVSGALLEGAGAIGLQDVLKLTPGVTRTELQQDLYRITIRGIQSDASNVTPQTAGLFIDEVPVNDPFLTQVSPDLPLFDLASVEVLKGPQGTLFGGSGLAGAIRYNLADAEPGVRQFKSFGQYQTVSDGSPSRVAGTAVNLPLRGQNAALRLVGVRRLTGGTIDDLRNDQPDTDRTSSFSGRALLRWNVSDRLSLGLKGLHQSGKADDVPLAETTDGRLERERALRKSPSTADYDLYGLDVRYALPWADFVSVTSVLRKSGDLSVAYAERILGVEDLGQPLSSPLTADIKGAVQEFRLVSPENGDWQWLAGLFGHDYAGLSTQRIFAEDTLTARQTELLDFAADVDASEYALFGEVSRFIGERWRLSAGLRLYQVETTGTVVSSGPLILATGSAENRNDADVQAQGVNPKLALEYQLSDRMSSYAAISRGFRFGGIQIVGPSPVSPNVPPTYSPDSIWSHELGLRTEWLQGALHVDGAAFFLDWRDPQVQTTTGGAVPLNVIDNVGGARSYGAELALRYLLPFQGWAMDLAAAYADVRTTSPYTAPSGATVPTGARLPGHADVHISAVLSYSGALGNSILGAAVSQVVQGNGVNDIQQSLRTYDYSSTDIRLSVRRPDFAGTPTLSLGVTNLTDERAILSAFVQSPDNFTTVYMSPRALDLRLDFEF